jgi:hypothetical protein
MKKKGLRTGRVAAGLALLLLIATACAGLGRGREWGGGVDLTALESGPSSVDRARLMSLSSIFYGRISGRRFNSKATYDDPALREFFRSAEAFSDYYADLAEALDSALFESHRPTLVRLRKVEPSGPGRVRLHVHFRGENRLPLRWWSTHLDRVDEWEYFDGRWWIVPGKV